MRNADMPYAFMIENQRARNKKRTEYGLRIIEKNVWQKNQIYWFVKNTHNKPKMACSHML